MASNVSSQLRQRAHLHPNWSRRTGSCRGFRTQLLFAQCMEIQGIVELLLIPRCLNMGVEALRAHPPAATTSTPTHTSHTYWGAQQTPGCWGGSFPGSAMRVLCKHTQMLQRKEGGKTTSNEMPYYGNVYRLRASLCLCCISEIKIKAFVALQRFLHI